VLSHAFSDHALARQEPLIRTYIDLLMEKLLRESKARQTIDLVPWFTSTAMDVILDLSFGRSLNCLEDTTGDGPHPWVDMVTGHVRQGLFVQAWRRLPAFVSRNLFANLALMVIGRQWKKQFDVTTSMARERRARGTEREDFGEIFGSRVHHPQVDTLMWPG
jgi:cytochrome P450